MKISGTWFLGSIAGKIMMGLVVAAMVGGAGVAPALGRDNHNRVERHDNGRYAQRGRGYGHDPGRREYRPGYPGYYRERVYAPPRVIYEPPAPPGIGIFFPPIIIRP